MSKKLLRPEQVKDWLVRRYNNQHRAWLEGGGEWPLTVALGVPSEADVAADLAGVRAWVESWGAWTGPGSLETQDKQWARLGSQTLPAAVALAGPEQVSSWCGQERRWRRAKARYDALLARWEQLKGRPGLARHFDVLADYSDADFDRLLAALGWFLAFPASGLYIRQLPIAGVDTKWVEKRTGLITELLSLLRGAVGPTDFYEATGLLRLPHRIRLRVLCPELRREVGGLRDFEAPVGDLVTLSLRPRAVLVVENHESGVALPDFPGVVAFVGLGNSVSALSGLPWLAGVPAVYWGDIDTHGLAILSRARRALPGLRSVLMDDATLQAFKDLAVQEPAQHVEAELAELKEGERAVFLGLRAGSWGTKLRLEQERIPWAHAVQAVRDALAL